MRCSLAFLLSTLSLGHFDTWNWASTARASQETRLGEDIGEVGVESTASAGSEDGVGMVDVCSGEILDGGLEGCKSNDDLFGRVSNVFRFD